MSRILLLVAGLWLSAGAALAQDAAGLARFVAGAVQDAEGGAELRLDLSQGVPWRAYTLADPWRLVLDFREVDWTGAEPDALDASARVSELRMGPLQPGWSRLVALLDRPAAIGTAALRVDGDGGTARLELTLRDMEEEAARAAAGAPPDPRFDLPAPRARRAAPDGSGLLMVVLDPGHGGIDPGAQRGGVDEADLVLQFARELRDELRRTGRYEVVLTRETDVFVSLEARVAAAHDAGADLFLSLHADAIEEGIAHGSSVYTLSEDASDEADAALAERHDRDDLLSGLDLSGADDRVARVLMDLARLDNGPRSAALAGHLVAGIKGALGHVHRRPLRQADFSVLKSADIPSVLVELGFLSTERDLKNLQDPAWRAGMAAGIRDGIEAWALEDAALSRLRRQ
ncbi:N-acetylmuramoyl-L-alanine amidase [Thetidibacter halocola]|uniref:N-acetylmuramoyl-L-alanine amidase n=1 Tax=Thetidibacter halocola TaxID=2827239 RepID=A0A8J7WC67_9RHOB|nr:N-acetylmuramoyl-L-alanine amidase [Thetidibacter halocola]MBS0122726.1 N-acetylmuramoyl-L-alanine amidase [Thetidibacter halocola]